MRNYYIGKAQARQLAIELQYANFNTAQSWEEVNQNSDWLYRLAKRFGLIKEFRENGLL